ncbi:hypothetical protein PGIGA_G00144790 [Pangasianodon gigas]|uniref:Uncharacterized protein n=1 Tax=Pangasianodon gigas TaxID=30993 RepID=A0ACC5XMD4_PANGG|nr:hypothetical protein [Pangasianodon gigas]
MSREITPGEPIDVYLPLTDRVEVSFTASDAAQPSDLQICTVDNEKIQCSPDYKERASRFNTLQIKDGNVSDSGNYTVQDIENDETLAILKVHMRVAATVSGERSVKAKLDHPATLTCDWKCSGSLKWTLFDKPGSVLARCDQTSCRSEERFNISHDQYLKGNPHLTITAADYSTRGLYTCQCDGKDVCDVRLVIETQVMSREITPGEPIDVYLPLTDLVEVSFTASDAAQPSDLQICTVDNEKIQCSPDYKERASRINTLQIKDGHVSDTQVMSREITPGEPIDVYLPLTDLVEVSFTASDAAQPSDLQICTVDNEKIQCSPDYKERASRFNTLQIKDGHVSDSGSYTVRDIVNDETLAIVKVHMRGKRV